MKCIHTEKCENATFRHSKQSRQADRQTDTISNVCLVLQNLSQYSLLLLVPGYVAFYAYQYEL